MKRSTFSLSWFEKYSTNQLKENKIENGSQFSLYTPHNNRTMPSNEHETLLPFAYDYIKGLNDDHLEEAYNKMSHIFAIILAMLDLHLGDESFANVTVEDCRHYELSHSPHLRRLKLYLYALKHFKKIDIQTPYVLMMEQLRDFLRDTDAQHKSSLVSVFEQSLCDDATLSEETVTMLWFLKNH